MAGRGRLRNTHVFFWGVCCSTEPKHCTARLISFSVCQGKKPRANLQSSSPTWLARASAEAHAELTGSHPPAVKTRTLKNHKQTPAAWQLSALSGSGSNLRTFPLDRAFSSLEAAQTPSGCPELLVFQYFPFSLYSEFLATITGV